MSGNDQTMVGSVERPSLRVTLSGGKQFVEILEADEVRLGRSLDCDLVLEDAGISRKHARICLVQGQWHVQDMQSANGVFVNATKVQDAVLNHGDELALGNAKLSFIFPGTLAGGARDAQSGSRQWSDTRTVMKKHAGVKKKRPSRRPAGAISSRAKSRGVAVMVALGGALALVLGISFWAGQDKPRSQSVASSADSVPGPPDIASPAPDLSASPRGPDPVQEASEGPPHGNQGQPVSTTRDETSELAAIFAEAGQIYYDSGRYPDAVAQWSQSLALDPSNEVVRIKLETTREELLAKADASYAMGLKNFEFLNYEEAIRNWNYVMHLIPDPKHPLHQNALKNVEQARTRMRR